MAIREADTEAAAVPAEAPKGIRRFASKKVVLALTGLLFLGGAGFGAMSVLGGSHEAEAEASAEQAVPAPELFYTLPEFTVNVSGTEDRPQFLRMKVALQAGDQAAIDAIEPRLPRIVDIFQVYLRELRASDLQGSAGLYRLREELTRRVNMAIAPLEIEAVLFQEIFVQ